MTNRDKERIKGREWAEECIAVAKESGCDFLEGFTRQVKREFAQQTTPPDSMTEAEAIAFEKEHITFGMFGGTTWGETPCSYITWLVDINLKLFKYIKSDRFKRRVSDDPTTRILG